MKDTISIESSGTSERALVTMGLVIGFAFEEDEEVDKRLVGGNKLDENGFAGAVLVGDLIVAGGGTFSSGPRVPGASRKTALSK